ncbi:GntR family transcriptional regulator [Verminephrobacter eiseniae]|uniref:GntR family transcriptional regulator n=1 Tax=Verminephrobacter eiseniae TaxID=364317 RepID=UPI0022387D7D|nr:GntR family transcriptional regulator [Verminephrobacter eiseniae]MCW5230267.1 GntR family transcriptional regulator [Verminephrobacter eiseniae]MCW5292000.1 GntR family transcriptional regulator [Verminephrobacter eiseniae]MCW8185752.1 GntR family transcriptional regulator [Verminephrobacter eiseniae]MCW8225820.1 GntR family transcriptional regulator [Verminephrobacter eiseniae]MCW8236159.1 GntR family transcriptional regulator [Verminephrobacter eiseniae]
MNKPRFTDIARHLKEGIASGHFPLGSLLPTELALRDHYQTSRHTVRMALQELQDAGLVSRRKNVGTRVESAVARAGFQQSLASVEDLMQYGAAHLRLAPEIDTISSNAALSRLLGCAAGTRWLRISSMRMEAGPQGLPLGWTDIYVDTQYEALEAHVRAAPDTLVSALIEQHYGLRVAEIVQQVRAVDASAAMAKRLHVEAGSATLQILRHYLDADGEVLVRSVATHPGERFFFTTRLQRAKG